MRAVVQRVHWARIQVGGETVARTDRGLLVLLGIGAGDTPDCATWMARKIAGLRIFPDHTERFNLSVQDVGGSVLVVSQFTLYGDAQRGFRPSFSLAAPPAQAQPLYERVAELLRSEHNLHVETGIFGAMMDVESSNWGPVTILLEKESGSQS
ncbi:MAG: D-aminoacyl-tRNA deacylase [Candidatus Kapaibacterium sp.]|nr:MAG: D-aminoacyl-tRNA deacylase [Candidatus Kapabacteria bacterium]